MSKIVAAVGSTKPVGDGPTRSEALQSAMAEAERLYWQEFEAACEAWRSRQKQDDGTNSPVPDYGELLRRKIEARTAAKADFSRPRSADA